MKKVFSLVMISLLLGLWACGSKKSPTGGKEDLEKPVLTASLPAEFSSIEKGVIELSFSKYLDKASVSSGLYIYPLIQNKKVTVEKSKITIRIQEDLAPDTNYFVTLTTRIKDIRGNALAQNQTLVYASGTLQRNRLSGVISYEDPKDRPIPVQFSLFSADSIQVLSTQLQGGAFAIDELNPAPHIYRAYQDKNINGRYDLGLEPWAEGKINVKGIASIELMMAYVDTVLAGIVSVNPVSNRELSVVFSEAVSSLASIQITAENGAPLHIVAQDLKDNILNLITSEQAKTKYELSITGLTDRKSNTRKLLNSPFQGTSNPDTSEPKVLSSSPRNGTSVSTQRPLLTINFNELINPQTVYLSLKAAENGEVYDFEILPSNPKQLSIRPEQSLPVNRSYQLIIDAKLADYSGNCLSKGYTLNFLVLNKN